MRAAIRDYLKGAVDELDEVYYPYSAKSTTPRPYAVIKLAGDSPSYVNEEGYFGAFQVWLYGEGTDYEALDAIAEKVKSLLHERILTTTGGKVFQIYWDRKAMGDFYDPELDAICERHDFTIPQI